MELTLDSIRDVEVFQPKKGYRFSVDAVLLAHYVSGKAASIGPGIELGAGSGIVSILLAKRQKKTKLVAVELQRDLAECAERNVYRNGLGDRVEILEEDIRNLKGIFKSNSFSAVYSNPPFRKTRSGRLSTDRGRALARHEIEITLPDIVDTASYLLKNRGRFYLIYHPFRLIELIGFLKGAGLEPKRMRFVHSREGEEAKMVLVEAVKNSGAWLTVDPPLFVYGEGRTYSTEIKRMFSG